MKTIVNAVKTSVQSFVKDEEGVVGIEYALVGGLVSIGMVAALNLLTLELVDALGDIEAALATVV